MTLTDVLKVSEAIRRIRSDRDGLTVLQDLKAHPRAAEVLSSLLSDSSRNVREWAVMVAPEVMGRAAMPLLQDIARRRSGDIRTGAIMSLLEIDPEGARPLLPIIHGMVRSADWEEPIFALWTIARLGDAQSVRPVTEFLESQPPNEVGRARVATIVRMVLERDSRRILDLLATHANGHDWTRDLAAAAEILGTLEARHALAACVATAPDVACRTYCSNALEAMSRPGATLSEIWADRAKSTGC